MNIGNILEELRRERDRIDAAITALEQLPSSNGRRGKNRVQRSKPVGRPRRKRRLTPEGRRRLSEMMKKRWAERKKRNKAA